MSKTDKSEPCDICGVSYSHALSCTKNKPRKIPRNPENGITHNYNDSLEDVDRFNESTGGGIW